MANGPALRPDMYMMREIRASSQQRGRGDHPAVWSGAMLVKMAKKGGEGWGGAAAASLWNHRYDDGSRDSRSDGGRRSKSPVKYGFVKEERGWAQQSGATADFITDTPHRAGEGVGG